MSTNHGAPHREWDSQQLSYWSDVTHEYDTYYSNRWSELENEWVAARLGFLGQMHAPHILDLGCGTGLGASLASRWTSLNNYVGVDISPAMTTYTAEKYGVQTRIAAMDELSWAPAESYDAVLCLFSAASLAKSPSQFFGEVSRVLRPGGRAYISTLGRGYGRDPQEVRFRTRGASSRASVPAWRFRSGQLVGLASTHGLRVDSIEGMNALSGVCEIPALWEVGAALARALPSASHLIEMTCSRSITEESR